MTGSRKSEYGLGVPRLLFVATLMFPSTAFCHLGREPIGPVPRTLDPLISGTGLGILDLFGLFFTNQLGH